MSFFAKLFGKSPSAQPAPEAVEYEGYNIFLALESGEGGYRVGAVIEKDFDGETKSHHMIRADRINSQEEAEQVSINKAKMLIDQMGDRIFA